MTNLTKRRRKGVALPRDVESLSGLFRYGVAVLRWKEGSARRHLFFIHIELNGHFDRLRFACSKLQRLIRELFCEADVPLT
jgi:hypothetical protein